MLYELSRVRKNENLVMKLFLATLGASAAEIALSAEDIAQFKCRQNAWQLPQVKNQNVKDILKVQIVMTSKEVYSL